MMHHSISAIILAAGMSRRMGSTKALLDFGGRPLVSRILESLIDASIDSITIVTGHEPQRVKSAVKQFDVNFVQNDRYAIGGMISSVQSGVAAVVNSGCEAFFLALGDHAPVEPATLVAMAAAWRKSYPSIVLPRYANKHGHPILVSIRLAPQILALTGDQSLATIVRAHSADSRNVAVDDPAILEDIDTPDDYNRALTRWIKRNKTREQEHLQ
jgi:molybdenum cofactor cytidylyltransferase